MVSSGPVLSDHLISLPTSPPYSAAIEHPFLQSAADGLLSRNLLFLWLSQDRIYAARAYPRFIGALISNIPFGKNSGSSPDADALNKRILDILVFSLNNILAEIEFFESTAKKWDLNISDWKERKGTRDYTAEMARVGNSGNIEDGLIFLWAMEKVYLDAWTRVRHGLTAARLDSESEIGVFATNWSSPEFSKFVDDLANLINDLGIQPGSETWSRAERIWARVVELEVEFWPLEGEEA